MAKAVDKIRILFLAASPGDTSKLQLDKEARNIDEKIRASKYRDDLELITRWAVRVDDLHQALLEVEPHVLHFSGHGTDEEAIVLVDEEANAKPVAKEALKHLLTVLKDNLQLVVLNACYSRPQAVAITECIDCAVGMNTAIGDTAAILFAGSFYRGIGFGRNVKQAFELGVSSLMLADVPEEKTPELLVREGVDASSVFLVRQLETDAVVRRGRPEKTRLERSATEEFEFDVFLCHNSKEKPSVKRIAEELKETGIRPWLDEWELRPGLPWQQALEHQIESIGSAAVFVGSEGMGPWQHRELDAFLREFVNRGVPVIPVLLEDAADKPRLPPFLSSMTWVDFRASRPDPMEQLVWGITGTRGTDPPSLVKEEQVASLPAQTTVDEVTEAKPESLTRRVQRHLVLSVVLLTAVIGYVCWMVVSHLNAQGIERQLVEVRSTVVAAVANSEVQVEKVLDFTANKREGIQRMINIHNNEIGQEKGEALNVILNDVAELHEELAKYKYSGDLKRRYLRIRQLAKAKEARDAGQQDWKQTVEGRLHTLVDDITTLEVGIARGLQAIRASVRDFRLALIGPETDATETYVAWKRLLSAIEHGWAVTAELQAADNAMTSLIELEAKSQGLDRELAGVRATVLTTIYNSLAQLDKLLVSTEIKHHAIRSMISVYEVSSGTDREEALNVMLNDVIGLHQELQEYKYSGELKRRYLRIRQIAVAKEARDAGQQDWKQTVEGRLHTLVDDITTLEAGIASEVQAFSASVRDFKLTLIGPERDATEAYVMWNQLQSTIESRWATADIKMLQAADNAMTSLIEREANAKP